MKRRYATITGFMGQLQDRFAHYQEARSLEEKMELISQIEKCQGVEVVFPQDFDDPLKLKELLHAHDLQVSAVNLNVKTEDKWRTGSFSSPNPEIRSEAVAYLKRAMDCAVELGCNTVTTSLLNDGSDYPFEVDYIRAFEHTREAILEAAEYRSDIRISLEYKASEPRVHCLLNNAGKMASLCMLIGKPNVGVTLDVGHALQCMEIPADSAAFLFLTKRLFHVHLNDNNRVWDWDLLPGTHNLLQQVEFFLYLKRLGYGDWLVADVYPQRHDPVRFMTKAFEWTDFLIDLAEKIDESLLYDHDRHGDNFDALEHIRSLMHG